MYVYLYIYFIFIFIFRWLLCNHFDPMSRCVSPTLRRGSTRGEPARRCWISSRSRCRQATFLWWFLGLHRSLYVGYMLDICWICDMGMDQYLLIPFLGWWTSINPSYFDVNYRGTRFWHTAIYPPRNDVGCRRFTLLLLNIYIGGVWY